MKAPAQILGMRLAIVVLCLLSIEACEDTDPVVVLAEVHVTGTGPLEMQFVELEGPIRSIGAVLIDGVIEGGTFDFTWEVEAQYCSDLLVYGHRAHWDRFLEAWDTDRTALVTLTRCGEHTIVLGELKY